MNGVLGLESCLERRREVSPCPGWSKPRPAQPRTAARACRFCDQRAKVGTHVESRGQYDAINLDECALDGSDAGGADRFDRLRAKVDLGSVEGVHEAELHGTTWR